MPKAIHDKKIVWQRNRWIEVYAWSIQAAEEILEATQFCRMVYPGTSAVYYLAEIITEKADQTLSDRLLYERMNDLYERRSLNGPDVWEKMFANQTTGKIHQGEDEKTERIFKAIKECSVDLVGGLNNLIISKQIN